MKKKIIKSAYLTKFHKKKFKYIFEFHLLKNFEDFADRFANRQKVTHLFHLVTTHQDYLKKQFRSIHTVPYHKFIAQKDYQHNACVI